MNDEIITKAFDFWERLSDAEKALILNNTKEITYEQGQIIHSADQNCIGVVIVKSGGLRTYILSEDGREITLYRLGEKEVCILSASCLLKNITFDVYIEAECDSKVLLLSAKYERICRELRVKTCCRPFFRCHVGHAANFILQR